MKFLIGLIAFCALVWYGATNWGWFDWANQPDSIWYQLRQDFSKEKVEQKRLMREKRMNDMF